MNTSDIDRVLADLNALAAEDQPLAAPSAVRARVMAVWDERAAAAPSVTLRPSTMAQGAPSTVEGRWWNDAGLGAVSAAIVLLAVVLGRAGISKQDPPFAVVESEFRLAVR